MTIMFIPVSNWNHNVNQGASVTFYIFLSKEESSLSVSFVRVKA